MRSLILAASRNTTVEHLVETAPVTRSVVAPVRARPDARTTRSPRPGGWSPSGLAVSLDHLGEDTTDPEQAAAAAKAYLDLLDRLAAEGLDPGRPRSAVKLSAVGQALPGDGERIALENAHRICAAAERGRHHGHPRHGGPHHHRLDAGDPAPSCARTSRPPARCCRPTCAGPRPTAGTWPRPAPGSGCARARTRSRSRWRSRTAPRWTSPTCAA